MAHLILDGIQLAALVVLTGFAVDILREIKKPNGLIGHKAKTPHEVLARREHLMEGVRKARPR